MGDSVITLKGRKKLARARVGEITLPVIKGMAFGTGGVDEDGKIIVPSIDQNELNNEIYRREYDSYAFIDDITCRYTLTLGNSECAGQSISEVALYDEDGDLIGIKNFLPKGKDEDIEMTFDIDDAF